LRLSHIQSGSCLLALLLGIACSASKAKSPADGGTPPLGDGPGGADSGFISGSGGVPASDAAGGRGGAGELDGSIGTGGSGGSGTSDARTKGDASGTGGQPPADGPTPSDGARGDSADAPKEVVPTSDVPFDSRSVDARIDAAGDAPQGNRCTTLQLGTGRSTYDGIIVDVDRDGRLDIVTAETGSTAVFRQTAPRVFADPDVYDVPNLHLLAVELADLNEDGVLDFAAATAYGSVAVLLSVSGGVRSLTTFSGSMQVGLQDIGIADFDGNGHLDMVVPVFPDDTLGFLWDDGPGKFLPRADQATGKNPSRLSIIDANEDGLPDLVVACAGGPSRVHINNGDRTFTSVGLFQTSRADALATGDVNNDGHVDIVVADIGYKRVVVLLGDGKGGFSQPTGLVTTTKDNPWSSGLGDFDHDGKLDLVLGHRDDKQVLVYRGNGDGHFQTEQPKAIPIPKAAISMTAGDVDGDGFDDFVATSTERGVTLVFGPCP
jgi:hypothetical protein